MRLSKSQQNALKLSVFIAICHAVAFVPVYRIAPPASYILGLIAPVIAFFGVGPRFGVVAVLWTGTLFVVGSKWLGTMERPGTLPALVLTILFQLGIGWLITKLKKMREDLQHEVARRIQAETRAAESARFLALGHMAGGIAHEINNPLAILQGRIEIMLAQPEAPTKEMLQICLKMSDRISRIVRALKTISSSGERGHTEEIAVRPLIEDLEVLLRPKTASTSVQVIFQVPTELVGHGRRHALEQILVNLLHNAIDAAATSPAPRVVLTLEMAEQDTAVFTVEDNGNGIPGEIAERIFEPFFTTKPVGKGTGLGLSLCRTYAEELGGTLTLENRGARNQSGAVFCLKIPRFLKAAKESQKAA